MSNTKTIHVYFVKPKANKIDFLSIFKKFFGFCKVSVPTIVDVFVNDLNLRHGRSNAILINYGAIRPPLFAFPRQITEPPM